MAEIDRQYVGCLEGMSLDDLDRHEGSIYGIWHDFRLAYMNTAWFNFALANGGEPEISTRWRIGRPITEAFPDVIRTFYEKAYTDAMCRGETWHHRYECSSAEIFRIYHQMALPLKNRCGILIVNSLVVEKPHRPVRSPVAAADMADYANANGILRQCCHCRRFAYRGRDARWDWIPTWIKQLPATISHAICPVCYDYYYRYQCGRT